ncbi:MAG: hypothetical protein HOV81_19335 [Kofleriaceae bacterium]|nr:hypothetical protein [Kofleriaceae bacterium]
MKYLVLACVVLAACQDNVSTPFPPGLEPFEDNPIAAMPDGPFVEGLRMKSSDNDFIRVYARGFVTVPFDEMWAATKSPTPNISSCQTSESTFVENNEPQYEYSFLLHYIVHDILTVQWDDQWRFGRIDPELGMIKHQKVEGSDFIDRSEGTIQVLATADPGVTELVFVEHLEAVSAGTDQVEKGVRHNYDALVATAHGTPIPPCP